MSYQLRKQAIYAEYAESYDSDRAKLVCAEGMERRVHFYSEAVRDGDTVLDLGCGTGVFLKPLAERNPHGKVIGVDISEDMLALARHRLNGVTNVELRQADLSGVMPFADCSFDAVIASNVNYEVPDTELLMREVRRLLKPFPPERVLPQLAAGLVCLRDNSPVNQAYARIARERLLWHFLTCDELIEIVQDAGLHIVGHRPVFIENKKYSEAIMKRKVAFAGFYRVYDELAKCGYDPSMVSQGHIWVQAIRPKNAD